MGPSRAGWLLVVGAAVGCFHLAPSSPGGEDASSDDGPIDAIARVDASSPPDVLLLDVAPDVCAGVPEGGACPNGLCRAGLCDQGSCRITGAWVAHGTRDPDNSCGLCDVTKDRLAWTTDPDGTACHDGMMSGACRSTPSGTSCCTGCWDGASCLPPCNLPSNPYYTDQASALSLYPTWITPGCYRGGAVVYSGCILDTPTATTQGSWAARGGPSPTVHDVCNQDNLCYGCYFETSQDWGYFTCERRYACPACVP